MVIYTKTLSPVKREAQSRIDVDVLMERSQGASGEAKANAAWSFNVPSAYSVFRDRFAKLLKIAESLIEEPISTEM
jgi:hypothetical protein